MIDIKRAVSDGRRAKILRVTQGEIWYSTEFGEEFPVPTSEVGGATFRADEKALLLMRYIRIHNKSLQTEKPSPA